MNAVSGTILLILLLVVFLAPRRWALLGFMTGVFFLTQGHSLDVAGLTLWPIRLLEVAGFTRVVIRRELVWSQLNRIDKMLLLVYNYVAGVWILHSSAFTFEQLGLAVDATLCYLALRGMIACLEDVTWFLKAFLVLLVPYVALVFVERLTGQSPFVIVGAGTDLYMREGLPRCQGSFRHATLLGSVAAAFLPLYIALVVGGARLRGLLGSILCLLLVVLSNSGGPLSSLLVVLVGWSLWSLRQRMFIVRRALVGIFIFLLLFMKAPIWYLPFKVSNIVGGGGYHRGLLMDKAWQDLDKWWLAGMAIEDTAPWFPYVHPLFQGADITNQFVLFGVRAGLPSIILLIVLLTFGCKAIGHGLETLRTSTKRTIADELLVWGLGVTLVVHIVNWLGIAYFDQSYAVWLMHLAAISGAVQSLALGKTVRTISIGEISPRASFRSPAALKPIVASS